jgi:hypothetical protein
MEQAFGSIALDLEALVVRPCSEPPLQLGVRRFIFIFVLGLPAVRQFHCTIFAEDERPSSRCISDRKKTTDQ